MPSGRHLTGRFVLPTWLADRAVSKWAEKLLRAGCAPARASDFAPCCSLRPIRAELRRTSCARIRAAGCWSIGVLAAPATLRIAMRAIVPPSCPNCTPRTRGRWCYQVDGCLLLGAVFSGRKNLVRSTSFGFVQFHLQLLIVPLSRFSSLCGKGAKLNRRLERSSPC